MQRMKELDEQYYAGMLNEEDSHIFEDLSGRVDAIEEAYINLSGQERSLEEEQNFKACHNNLLDYYKTGIGNDDDLMIKYRNLQKIKDNNPLAIVAMEALQQEMEARGLQVQNTK